MSPVSEKEQHRQVLLHFWNQGVHTAKELHNLTNKSLQTIYYNIKKLEKKGNNTPDNRSGRPKKITAAGSRILGQQIRRNYLNSLRTLATRLSKEGIEASYATVSRHLKSIGYKKSLPVATPMLTPDHKKRRVEWAKKHLNDNWKKTLFTDETAFQLFRNTIKRWHKGERPVRPLPKDRTKILAWGGFYIGGKPNLFCFFRNMDAAFYVEILQKHIPEVYQMM